MSQVHILPWAPPESFAAGTLGLECPKLGTLALGFLWLVDFTVHHTRSVLPLLFESCDQGRQSESGVFCVHL